jgi:hypothetical protein
MSINTEHFGTTLTRISSCHRKSLESKGFGERPAINVGLSEIFIRKFLSTIFFYYFLMLQSKLTCKYSVMYCDRAAPSS